jgi:hypothetical protein
MNEGPGSFAQALDPLTAHYLPADPVEEELIGQMAFAKLNLARLAGIETGLLDRYQSRHTRNFLRLLKTLEDRRKTAPQRPRQTNLKPPPEHPGAQYPWNDSRNLTGPAIQARMQAALAKQTQVSVASSKPPVSDPCQSVSIRGQSSGPARPPRFGQKALLYSCPGNLSGLHT